MLLFEKGKKPTKYRFEITLQSNAKSCLNTCLRCHTVLKIASHTWHWIQSHHWASLNGRELLARVPQALWLISGNFFLVYSIWVCFCLFACWLGFLFFVWFVFFCLFFVFPTRLLLKNIVLIMWILLELHAFQRKALHIVLYSVRMLRNLFKIFHHIY